MKSVFEYIKCCFSSNKDENSEIKVDQLKSFDELHQEQIKFLENAKNEPRMKYLLNKEVNINSLPQKYHLPISSDPFEHMDMKAYNYFNQKEKLNYSFEYIYTDNADCENNNDKNERDKGIKIVVKEASYKDCTKVIENDKLLSLNYKSKSFNTKSSSKKK